MRTFIIFIIFILPIIAILLWNSFQATLPQDPQPQYDYFKMVQVWPNAFCKFKNCTRDVQIFTLHGLWPEKYSGEPLENCSEHFVPEKAFRRIEKDMLKYWPNLKSKAWNASLGFWRYQYKKHGSCCDSMIKDWKYFDLAIRRRKQYELLDILKAAGIQPNGSYYKTEDIIDALRNGTEWKPDIQCIKGYLLYQIILCVQANGSEFQHCKGNQTSSCRNGKAKFISAESMTDSLLEKENAPTELEHEDGNSSFEL